MNPTTRKLVNVALVGACAAAVLACYAHRHPHDCSPGATVREPVNLQTIQWMRQQNWPEERMLHEIRNRGVNPALAPDDIITLTNAGLSQQVIDAAVNAPTSVEVRGGHGVHGIAGHCSVCCRRCP